jgi:hypothetical protein
VVLFAEAFAPVGIVAISVIVGFTFGGAYPLTSVLFVRRLLVAAAEHCATRHHDVHPDGGRRMVWGAATGPEQRRGACCDCGCGSIADREGAMQYFIGMALGSLMFNEIAGSVYHSLISAPSVVVLFPLYRLCV